MSKKLLEQVESVLNEAANPSKKDFIKYAEEIFGNILKVHNLDIGEIDLQTVKQLQRTIVSIFVSMGQGKSGINYAERKKYFPKKYDITKFDNGDGNLYDSDFYSLLDTQHFTITRDAIKKYVKGKGDLKFDIKDMIK